MRTRIVGIAATAVFGALSATAWAGIDGVSLGTSAPPSTLGGFSLTSFGLDPRPQLTYVTDAAVPGGGVIEFDPRTQLRRAGMTWFHWGHGYTDSVYHTAGSFDVTIQLPPGTQAFVVYACSNIFGGMPMTVTCAGGADDKAFSSHVLDDAASGWGFYATGDSQLQTVTVNAIGDFAVGEFLIAMSGQTQCPADLTGDGIVDFGDYLEFLNLFDAGDPRVDFTGDGIVDFSDYLEFLNLFDQGC